MARFLQCNMHAYMFHFLAVIVKNIMYLYKIMFFLDIITLHNSVKKAQKENSLCSFRVSFSLLNLSRSLD